MEVFSKILTRTDVSIRLEFPTKALNQVGFSPGEYTKTLSVTDKLGQRWLVDCCKRQRGHPKPCLRRGWIEFVRAKGIRVGDRVTFRKVDGDEFRIEAKRNLIKLLGKDIWVHVDDRMIYYGDA